jgi:hypothetical protein
MPACHVEQGFTILAQTDAASDSATFGREGAKPGSLLQLRNGQILG